MGLERVPKELYRQSTSVFHEQITQVVKFYKKLFYSDLRHMKLFICLGNIYGRFRKQPFWKRSLSHSRDERKDCYLPDRSQPRKFFPFSHVIRV